MALAFDRSCEHGRFHTATPFDSGGLIKPAGQLHSAFRLDLNPDTLAARVAYCRASLVRSPGGWRGELARWLAAYYPGGPAGYWEQLPQPDPEHLYSSNGNNWRAWTWEARLQRGPNVLEAEAWTADIGYINELDALLGSLPLGEDALNALSAFRQRCLTPEGSLTFCEDIESWTRQRCV